MRRVSSRQRLVSWDAFDATDPLFDSDVESNETYETCIQQDVSVLCSPTAAVKRKRKSVVHVIPNDNDNDSSNYLNLLVDLQLNILSFLDESDLRHASAVNRSSRHLMLSDDALETLWKPAVQRLWPWIPTTDISSTLTLSYLLSLAQTKISYTIDESLFVKSRWSRVLRHYRPRRENPEIMTNPDGSIQFNGTVGVGDRCIRANHALPKPTKKKTLNPFRKNSWKPFVVPYVGGHDDQHQSLVLTPRVISYFEITIGDSGAAPSSAAAECVAVGLANSHFKVHTRMPGWDHDSYGYHGDDGGIFHAAGSMVKHYGPSFGRNDTIGCGIDYKHHKIFFTKNGRFLGHAFELKESQLSTSWYPVVGMDTNAPVHVNFGAKRFVFDLDAMLAKSKL